MGAVLGALLIGAEALIVLVSLSAILANLFVVKQITLFGLEVTASDAYVIAGMLSLNLLQEYGGKALARKAIWISLGASLLYLIVSQLHLLLVPSAGDFAHQHFTVLMSPMPRIILASVVVYFIAQRFDYLLYGGLKRLFSGNHLVIRNLISLLTSQALDTVLFSFAGLYGLVASIWDVILFSYFIKCLVIVSAVPFIALSRKLLKRSGRDLVFYGASQDLFDRSNTSIQPLRLRRGFVAQAPKGYGGHGRMKGNDETVRPE